MSHSFVWDEWPEFFRLAWTDAHAANRWRLASLPDPFIDRVLLSIEQREVFVADPCEVLSAELRPLLRLEQDDAAPDHRC